jgi:hypothetical protein
VECRWRGPTRYGRAEEGGRGGVADGLGARGLHLPHVPGRGHDHEL